MSLVFNLSWLFAGIADDVGKIPNSRCLGRIRRVRSSMLHAVCCTVWHLLHMSFQQQRNPQIFGSLGNTGWWTWVKVKV